MRDEVFPGCLMVLVMFLVGACLIGIPVDCCSGSRQHEDAVVIARTYEPSRTSTGFTTDADGNMRTTTDTTPEKWTVIVRTESGETLAVNVRSDRWGQYEPGTKVQVSWIKGGVTGIRYVHRVDGL